MEYTNGIIPKMQDEINRLRDELATANAALIAQGQALADARKVIRNEAAYCEGMIDYANSYPVDGDEYKSRAEYLNEIIASWDSVADETEQESENQE